MQARAGNAVTYYLFYVYFGNVVALTADVEAGFGVGYAYALEVVVFGCGVAVGCDVVDAAFVEA